MFFRFRYPMDVSKRLREFKNWEVTPAPEWVKRAEKYSYMMVAESIRAREVWLTERDKKIIERCKEIQELSRKETEEAMRKILLPSVST